MSEEIWKDIKGFPGYQVSSEGYVRSFRDYHGNITDKSRILKSKPDKDGYLELTLYTLERKKVGKEIHKLVAEAFLGERPPGLVIDHINTNKQDNRASNLRYITARENSTRAAEAGLYKTQSVKIIETGEVFRSLNDCGKAIDYHPCDISRCISGKKDEIRGLHFEAISREEYERKKAEKQKPFLYPHQKEAVEKAFDGSIINGGVGSGKSRTGLYYFFKEYGGRKEYVNDYVPMVNPPDLYIITTAKKRNDLEWEGEMGPFLLTTHKENSYYKHEVFVDSWQNIQKYTDVKDSFFIFDEDHVTGYGAWTKAFLKITKSNRWIILSASPGDRWEDFIPVFIANGFYKNKTEFSREHLVYARYSKFPKVERYIGEQRLIRLRDKILINMDFSRHTIPHHEDIYVTYNIATYKDAIRKRWDPYKDEPVQQASGMCYLLRKIVNSDESRQAKLLELLEDHPKAIIFYNYDYERDILLNLGYSEGTVVAEYNGHAHNPVPDSDKWVYLCQYVAGCEGFNCIKTNTIIFYSQSYSYKTMIQAAGRIDRLNSPFIDLYYYHLKSRSGIDLAISKALREKKQFNERKWLDSWK